MVTGQVTQSNQKEATSSVQCFLVRGLPVIREGDDLVALIQSLFELQEGDILCYRWYCYRAKSERRFRSLGDYNPDAKARELVKNPRFVQAISDGSEDILIDHTFLVVKTKFVHT
jgi:coenzyme F420-0:L-glutamate ligase/coenzyme F420-1:gamma-L-glutamate ligase